MLAEPVVEAEQARRSRDVHDAGVDPVRAIGRSHTDRQRCRHVLAQREEAVAGIMAAGPVERAAAHLDIHRRAAEGEAVGEPPLMLAISVFEALGMAVASVAGYRIAPRLDAPATPERILMAVERLRKAHVA